MERRSIWAAAVENSNVDTLQNDLKVDVAIVGGGITGVVCAHLLAKGGLRVALLEALKLGEGSTGNSTGNLYSIVGETYHELNDENKIRSIIQSRSAAVDLIEQLVGEHGIECGFARRPWFMFSEDDPNPAALAHAKKTAQAGGLVVSDRKAPLPFKVAASISIENQAQFNPLQFVKQLANLTQSNKCHIFEHSKAIAVENAENEGGLCTVKTKAASVFARFVIMATHTPKGVLKIQTALGPYREYGIAAKATPDLLAPGIYWSTGSPHHSIRTHMEGDEHFLVVVGGNHKTGQEENTEACYEELAQFARTHFGLTSIDYRWSAQNYKPADGLPYIGPSALGKNIFIATGFAADGLTYGTLAAILLTDAVIGRPNDFAEVFSTRRFTPLASAKDFARENVNVLAQYLKDLPGTADADEFAKVQIGHGKTIEKAGEKLAAYRDETGALRVVSAVCTHMGCIVNWNTAEKT